MNAKKLSFYVTALTMIVFVGTIQPAPQKKVAKPVLMREELYEAAAKGDLVRLESLLVERHMNPNIRDSKGNTALHFANNKKTVEFLLQHGADINAQNNQGIARLHIDVMLGHLYLVTFLLNQKADVNIKDKNGITPLHLATAISYFQRPEVAERVVLGLEIASGVLMATIAHITVMMLAEVTMATAAEAAVISLATGAAAVGVIAATVGAVDIGVRNRVLELLIQAGANVNAQDKDGNAPLHTLATGSVFKPGERHGGIIIAQHLINNGADRTIKNNRGQTPYDVAKKNGRVLLLPILNIRKRLLFK